MQLLIRQAKLIDPRSGFHNKTVDILVEDGIIKNIGNISDHKADKVIEGSGLMVSPGWVDIMADYREPGFEQKETIASGLEAAAAGGFTDVFCMPNTNPVISNKSSVDFIIRKSAGHVVTLYPLGAVSQQAEGKVLSEMMDMRAHGAIAFTDGWKPVQSANLTLKALEYIRAFEGVLIQLPVEEDLSKGGLMHEGIISTRMGMPGIPEMAETLLLHRDIELLRYTDSRLHISGLSCATSVQMIRNAKAEGLDITCSVTPYHLALTEASLTGYSSMYKVTPPLRSEADRQALVAGLKDGTIDCIATHHRPQDWDAKEKEFEYAADGMNIQEIAFNILCESVAAEVGIDRLIDALAIRPRQIFGLQGAGIEKDTAATFTVFTTEGSHSVEKNNLRSASQNNPFIGQTLKGKVLAIAGNNKIHINN